MPVLSTSDRAHFRRLADFLAVAVAIVLPWSTTATGICVAVWLVVLLPTLDTAALKRELATAAGGLPVLLWCLGFVGMLWADVSWADRLHGLGSFSKLLIIPLLLAQFRRSEHARHVINGFFISSTTVLIVSLVLTFVHMPTSPNKLVGVPVHDDIFQNTEFLVCVFGLLGFAFYEVRKQHWAAALSFFAIAALFFVDLSIVIFSRIAPVVILVLLVLLGWRFFRWRGILGACVAAAVLGTVAWLASPTLRERVNQSAQEINLYLASNAATPIGAHMAFLRESLSIVAAAPLAGHGTGSIPEQFGRVSAGQSGASGIATVNPHNQTFAVAIQLGIIGAVVLWAMWIAHFLLFRGAGLTEWIGMVIVTENVVTSAVHSHLFDFANGWLYVFGVGVLGGAVLRERAELSTKPALAPAG
jgi:O-antigen ligase